MTKIRTTLVIPDPHDEPERPKERFDALGNFIVANQPDNLVQIGDFSSLDSVSPFDSKKPLIKEGRRLKDDLDSGREAYEAFHNKILAYNRVRSRSKRKRYLPTKFWFEANHEYRCRRYIEKSPELEGFIPSTDLLGVAEDGWGIVPYKEYRYIRGVAFTHIPHYFSEQPLKGKYAVHRATTLCANSVVFGHTHKLALYQVYRELDPDKQNKEDGSGIITSLNVGWFGDYEPDYTLGGTSVKEWWSGLVLLYHTGYGEFDIRTISMSELKKDYL